MLPDKPGVYLMKDDAGTVIYVGKAVSLRNRVRSYFQSSRNHGIKTQALVRQIANFETIVTDNEVEALNLESNLIKEYRPRYNVKLKDDKHYPYLKVTLNEPFPRLVIARQVKKDGARYFGPYPNSGAVHETIKLLRKLFPMRNCKKELTGEPEGRVCLNFHIKRCIGPCQGRAVQAEYDHLIRQVLLFLDGKQDELIRELETKMHQAAEDLDFEQAGELRDQIQAVRRITERQKMDSGSLEDRDVIAMARGVDEANVQVFFVRGGKMVGRENFLLSGTEGQERGEILASFVKQYYSTAVFVPKELLLQEEVDEVELLENWLSQKRGQRVSISTPKRGEKRELVEMVAKNALMTLSQSAERIRSSTEQGRLAMEELKYFLNLKELPMRIEAYDISNIQGSQTVASMVVFTGGMPDRKQYRRFRIRTVEGPNDFASMQEVITRRFANARKEQEAIAKGELEADKAKFALLPDLVLIDGGKGQLGAAREIMRQLGFAEISTIGLAKQFEWVFVEGRSEPIILPERSRPLYLIQRVRDEAHRFAITYHRTLRGHESLQSVLSEIPGIGMTRQKALLKRFTSLEKIAAAEVRELAEVPGMNVAAAEEVYRFFRKRSE